eukprot:CAMPEP_0115195126 /NCGR_PEP_ID=MMETSP0270-20121206/14420_1 /TAXON_ID=71861 /ORGANISM="Scrippsiella trochoidea, Strain CCMP3099" /LENGTH=93 /DNA_ID=CAMNT_0002608439 /DNA_START=183 /DNA_END=461 /DNA_ORIENTATION=-
MQVPTGAKVLPNRRFVDPNVIGTACVPSGQTDGRQNMGPPLGVHVDDLLDTVDLHGDRHGRHNPFPIHCGAFLEDVEQAVGGLLDCHGQQTST